MVHKHFKLNNQNDNHKANINIIKINNYSIGNINENHEIKKKIKKQKSFIQKLSKKKLSSNKVFRKF